MPWFAERANLAGRSDTLPAVAAVNEAASALDGRALGKRGAATRQRLLESTGELLESKGLRDLRVVDIAPRGRYVARHLLPVLP